MAVSRASALAPMTRLRTMGGYQVPSRHSQVVQRGTPWPSDISEEDFESHMVEGFKLISGVDGPHAIR